jgi:hypothetical protein
MTPEYATPPFVDYYIGLDIGRSKDFTAYAVVERSGQPGAYRYHVVALERMRYLPYPEICRKVQAMTSDPALRPRRLVPEDETGQPRLEWAPPATMVIDSSGVGEPITDTFLSSHLTVTTVPIKITGGDTWRRDRWPGTTYTYGYWVSKRLLCANILSLITSGRLRVIPTLKDANTLERELGTFKVELTKYGNETFGCWRENDHDDLVLATSLALWFAELRPVVHTIGTIRDPLAGRRWGLETVPTSGPRRKPPWGQGGDRGADAAG